MSEPDPPLPRGGLSRSWLGETWQRVRHRPDLIAGLTILTGGTAAACWIGMWEVAWYARIPIVLVAVFILVGMTLGMIHDYTDSSERDSALWLAEQAELRRQARTRPPDSK